MISQIRIPQLQQGRQIVDANGYPTIELLNRLNDAFSQIQIAINGIEQLLAIQAAIAEANAAAAAATAAAADATAAADNAQASADATTDATSLANSYVTGLTLTATDAGSNVTVNISAHTRVYGDGTSVAVNAGSVAGLPYSTTEYIYYSDPSRAGGAVTYQAATNQNTAAQTGDIHTVGSVVTPAAAAPPSPGKIVRPPGIGTLLL